MNEKVTSGTDKPKTQSHGKSLHIRKETRPVFTWSGGLTVRNTAHPELTRNAPLEGDEKAEVSAMAKRVRSSMRGS